MGLREDRPCKLPLQPRAARAHLKEGQCSNAERGSVHTFWCAGPSEAAVIDTLKCARAAVVGVQQPVVERRASFPRCELKGVARSLSDVVRRHSLPQLNSPATLYESGGVRKYGGVGVGECVVEV
jgi:hypothetical protein